MIYAESGLPKFIVGDYAEEFKSIHCALLYSATGLIAEHCATISL